MLRGWALALLLVNAFLLAWALGALSPWLSPPEDRDRDPSRTAQQVQPQTVEMLPAAGSAPSSAASAPSPGAAAASAPSAAASQGAAVTAAQDAQTRKDQKDQKDQKDERAAPAPPAASR